MLQQIKLRKNRIASEKVRDIHFLDVINFEPVAR
jgi:hypothetical protein